MKIDIASYDPTWAVLAEAEGARWLDALGDALVTVHHIGSTAVPGLSAKPVLDLMPEIRAGLDFDSQRHLVEGLGYEWMGEFGLPRRRYCRLSDPETGTRLVQAHCYTAGDSEITRHLAFRDALRGDPMLAGAYENRKRHCASVHFNDLKAYGRCKSDWIDTVEARALKGIR